MAWPFIYENDLEYSSIQGSTHTHSSIYEKEMFPRAKARTRAQCAHTLLLLCLRVHTLLLLQPVRER